MGSSVSRHEEQNLYNQMTQSSKSGGEVVEAWLDLASTWAAYR